MYIYKIALSLSYIVYRKEHIEIRAESTEHVGRGYDQISQIIKKKCYLEIRCRLQETFQCQ